jgi:hypothetical protein
MAGSSPAMTTDITGLNGRARGAIPQNFGGRFSANARMPSLISALRMLSR